MPEEKRKDKPGVVGAEGRAARAGVPSPIGEPGKTDPEAARLLKAWRDYVDELGKILVTFPVDPKRLFDCVESLLSLAPSAARYVDEADKNLFRGWAGWALGLSGVDGSFSQTNVTKIRKSIRNTFKHLGVILKAPISGPAGAKEEDVLNERKSSTENLEAALNRARKIAKKRAPQAVPAIEQALRLAAAKVVELPPEPPRLSEAMLEEFRIYAEAHPWVGDRQLSPSQFIREHYGPWLSEKKPEGGWRGPTLWRSDIAGIPALAALAAAYSQEVNRHPERAVKELYVKPHKMEPGTVRKTPWIPLSAELGQAELEAKRAAGAQRTRESRARRQPR